MTPVQIGDIVYVRGEENVVGRVRAIAERALRPIGWPEGKEHPDPKALLVRCADVDWLDGDELEVNHVVPLEWLRRFVDLLEIEKRNVEKRSALYERAKEEL